MEPVTAPQRLDEKAGLTLTLTLTLIPTLTRTRTPIATPTQGWNDYDFEKAYEYAVTRAHTIARGFGKTPIGWGEIWDHFGPALPQSTIIHFWLGGSRCADLKNATSHGPFPEPKLYPRLYL